MPWTTIIGTSAGWVLNDIGGYGNTMLGNAIFGGEVGSGEWASAATPSSSWALMSVGQLNWSIAPTYSAGWV